MSVSPRPSAALGRYFAAYEFVAAPPHIRAFHRERGFPDDISRHTGADFGRNMAFHRRQHGTGGVLVPQWLTRSGSGRGGRGGRWRRPGPT